MTAALLASDFTASSAVQGDVIAQFAFVAPIFLKQKGSCLVILPPDAKDGFDRWISAHRDTEDYDGFATLSNGFFGIRLTDNSETLREVLSEIGVYEQGRYIIAHRPARRGAAITYSTHHAKLAL
jgi:hypothetical protein